VLLQSETIPRLRYPVGQTTRLLTVLRRLLPQPTFERLPNLLFTNRFWHG
jgi:hypothetical protein